MPLGSRMTRNPTPVAAAKPAPVADENTSPRRRTLTPAQAGAAAAVEPRKDDLDREAAVDAAVQELSDAVSGAPSDAGLDDNTPPANDPPPPAVETQTKPQAPEPAKRRGPKPKVTVALPEGAAESDDPAVLRQLLRNIENDVSEARKQYLAAVQPLVEQYKAISTKIADLLPGKV